MNFSPCTEYVSNSVELRLNYIKGTERKKIGKLLETKILSGGADETRTRDLWRDRPAF